MTKPIYYFLFQSKTVFVPLKALYPECLVLIGNEPSLYPLKCLKDSCHKNANCGEVLAHRVHFFLENVTPEAELLVAYYKWQDRPNSIRAGLFNKSLDEPRQIICNKAAYAKFQRESTVYAWEPPTEFLFMGGSNVLVPVESLIRE